MQKKNFNEQQIDYAGQLLKHFVISFKHIYDVKNINHNIHGLLHISNYVKMFGPLDNFSTFKFKNYMQQLLKLIHVKNHPLQQIVKRLHEQLNMNLDKFSVGKDDFVADLQHNLGPLAKECSLPQFKRLRFKGFTLNVKNKKNWRCELKSGELVVIENIVYRHDKLCIIEHKFLIYKPFI